MTQRGEQKAGSGSLELRQTQGPEQVCFPREQLKQSAGFLQKS